MNPVNVVLVSFDGDKDIPTLLVGVRQMGKPVEIINGFTGKDAEELWKKLTSGRNTTHV